VLDSEGKRSRMRHQPYELEELAPGAARREATQDEEGGFRLLVYGGRQEDPRDRARREAQALMEKAQSESSGLVEGAQGEAESIRREAYQKGYDEGHQEGMAAARAMMTAAADNLGRAAEALESARAGVLAGLEAELVGLVQAACDRVLGLPEAAPQRLVKEVVVQAIARLLDLEKVTVRVSPKDVATLEEHRPEVLKRFTDLGRLNLVADQELKPGDCRVETPTAEVDATLDTRRRRVCEALSEALQSGQPLDLEPLAARPPGETEPDAEPAAETPEPDAEPAAEPGAGPAGEAEDW
jgi:flagellar assembly protein FliH